MLILVLGGKGFGKSTYITYSLYQLYKKGYQLYTNFELTGFPYDKINLNNLTGMFEKEHVAIAIDEASQYFDSRSSGKKENKYISYLLAQSRKRQTRIFMTTQKMRDIDLRARLNYDKLVLVKPYKIIVDKKGNKSLRRASEEDIFEERVDFIKVLEKSFDGSVKDQYYLNGHRYFSKFNTHELYPILY